MKEIDARGLSCPQPVVLVKKALDAERPAQMKVLVTGEAARENVSRFAAANGYRASVMGSGQEFTLVLERENGTPVQEVLPVIDCGTGAVLFITSDAFGEGNRELGETLMQAFVNVLGEVSPRPSSIIFANSGVRLAAEGSPVIESLRELEQAGVQITSCGTCLQFYGLKEKLRAGRIGNMYDIASSLLGAQRVIKL